MKFRKKPVVVDAFKWTAENPMELQLWFDEHGVVAGQGTYGLAGRDVFIKTLEGTMLASPGDWIICGVKGEFYPCKPDIFAATYEAVSP